jgi:transposase InsO family protein
LGLTKSERRELALALYENTGGNYPKRSIAKALKISRRNMYYQSKIADKDRELRGAIEELYETDDTLGCRKLASILGTGKNRIFRVMIKYGIAPRRKRKAYRYPGRADEVIENKLLQEDVENNTILFSDIFQFRLADGAWVYCCFIIRKKTRQVLSFCYSWGMRAELVESSIHRVDLVADLSDTDVIFHSDQGKQYGAKVTVDSISQCKFERSMSRAGTPTDNAYAERFVGIFKLAVVERYRYANLIEFEHFATQWLNFYNERRPHQSLKQKSPNNFAREIGIDTVPYLYLNFV